MRSSVERQCRVGIGQGCTCPLLQAAPTVPLAAAVFNKNNEFQCVFEVRDDFGQGHIFPPTSLCIYEYSDMYIYIRIHNIYIYIVMHIHVYVFRNKARFWWERAREKERKRERERD